jgi:diacylglycerol kinase family enzyme
MRLTLFHNPTAGDGRYVREELLVGLQGVGHDVQVCVDDVERAGAAPYLAEPGDAVLVAGGDGTVRRVAMRFIGRGVPIAILPLGTANNIARALGLPLDPAQVIRRLDSMIPWKCDVGRVTGPWGRNVFLEGCGFGPFVRTALLLSNPSQREAFDHSHAELVRDRHILEEMIRNYAVQAGEILLDDETVTGNFLAVHIMNLPSVGPNLKMAPCADPSDGYLDIVLVPDSDRREFADFVAAGRRGRDLKGRFSARRSRSVRLRWDGAEVHVDDDFYQPGKPARLHAWLVPGELTFLRPAPDI